jgi:hypothetical protein
MRLFELRLTKVQPPVYKNTAVFARETVAIASYTKKRIQLGLCLFGRNSGNPRAFLDFGF